MSETASQASGGTGAMSETSSQRSDSKMLRRHRAEEHAEEGDLMGQKRTFQEGVFACMYTLVRQSALSNWKFSILKVVLEGLIPLLVVFNPSNSWDIKTSNPVWQVIRWTLWRSPVTLLYGYDTYIRVLYVMAAAVLLAVGGLVWLTLAMRKQEQSKWLRKAAAALHVVYDILFMLFYASFMDYFVFTANCNFTHASKEHAFFTGVNCLEMPHILHMSVAAFAALVHFSVTALMVVASSDLNPISRGHLASPDSYSRLKILAAKALFIIFTDDLQSWPKLRGVLVVVAVGCCCWWNFRKLPFYGTAVNMVWSGGWVAVLYSTLLLTARAFDKDQSDARMHKYTQYVLYGIFPVLCGSIALCGLHAWWVKQPARKFKGLTSLAGVKIHRIHRFAGMHEVEVLSRVMRKFDLDGIVDEESAAHGELILQAGMQVYPDAPFLHILYANFLLEVRKDGPAARTHLQLASKHTPTLVERYQVYCTMEASKRQKDSQDGGMDLQAYIEFRRNFRAVLRVHKEVLALETELWRMCTRTTLRITEMDEMLDELETATTRANQVYKRVLERYPTNGKLLRCYGKFLEDVKHDAAAASRVYAEATRNGGGDAIMSLDLSSVQQAVDKPEFLTSMSLQNDAVIVIDAEGIILMVSQAVQSVFGYSKAELEGVDVALLMPQPFSQRHSQYMSRYRTTGESHILDIVREVVALHKDRYVFPLMICVTKMSGTGSDSVFLGVIRPLAPNSLMIRAWLAPNGTFLCGDQQFASMCGLAEKDLVGHSLSSLVAEGEVGEVDKLIERFHAASAVELESGLFRVYFNLKHRFLDPVPVELTVGLAGTDGQRIMSITCRRTDGRADNIMVVDTHMRVRFASLGVSTLLNYPLRKLTSMGLDELLPEPFDATHAKWLRQDPPHDPPAASCRSGRVVHLLNDARVPIPVRLQIHSTIGADGVSLYVIEIEKVPPSELLEEKRLVLTADMSGRVLRVSRPLSTLFGFKAIECIGRSLCDCVDIFDDWRTRNGESQLQLLILALTDKEQQMPGTSWRVRVQKPSELVGQDGIPHLPSIHHHHHHHHHHHAAAHDSKTKKTVSACLQVELADSAEGEEEQEVGGDAEVAADGFPGLKDSSKENSDARIKLTLWRRDLLTGVVELDENMLIRRASPLTGLIVGIPSASMLKKPLHRFLDIPRNKPWDAIIAHKHHTHHHHNHRSALKGSTNRGVVSPPMAFIGPHPDMGTMRILVQGVKMAVSISGTGRGKVTAILHPDTTYTGAHADLLRVLHLEGEAQAGAEEEEVDEEGGDAGRRDHRHGTPPTTMGGRQHHYQHVHAINTSDGGVEGGGGGDPMAAVGKGKKAMLGARDGGEGGSSFGRRVRERLQQEPADGGDTAAAGDDDDQEGDGGRSENSMERVRRSEQGEEEGEEGGGRDLSENSSVDKDGVDSATVEATGGDPEARNQARLLRRASSKAEFITQWVASLSKQNSMAREAPEARGSPAEGPECEEPLLLPAPPTSQPSAGQKVQRGLSGRLPTIPEVPMDGCEADGGERVGDGGGGDGDGDKWERGSEAAESSADGSQAAGSAITGTSGNPSMVELMIDARRGRLLRSLRKVLMGPLLMGPLERLRLHSYALLAVMLLTHIACYVVVTNIITNEHSNVYLVYRQAMAMDRAELIVVRVLIGTFCERANVTAKVSACTPPLSTHIKNMVASITTLEQNHQGVYMGFSPSKTAKPASEVYDVWTQPQLDYHLYMDTQPPQVLTEAAGVWQLGNRFIAAAREALYYMPLLKANFKLHRVYQFIVTNGIGSLFTGYATSLDLLMDSAWKSLDQLRTVLIVLLVVEVLIIQLLCLVYEWLLVRQVEGARLLGIMSMVGLPAPVLRQLASKETKVLDDSSDESDDDRDDVGEGEQEGAAAAAAAAAAANGKDNNKKTGPAAAAQAGNRRSSIGGLPDSGDGGPAKAVRGFSLDGQDLDARAADDDNGAKSKAQQQRAAGADTAVAAKARRIRRLGVQVVNGKALVPSRWRVSKLMLIPCAWFFTLLAIYGVSLYQLEGMQGPLASLNMASHVIYRYTRIRAVGFKFLSQDDTESKSLWRDMLRSEIRLFDSEYMALMYGGTALSQVNSVFTHPVPASTFSSSMFAYEFFKTKRCFRYNQTLCAKPGSKYYEVTHNGLDVMVRRMISEMELLVTDPDQDAVYNGSRWDYMYNVGTFDLYEGLQQAAELFVDYSISRYNQVTRLHSVLLAITFLLLAAYVVLTLWPHLAKLKGDAARQSALLSHVPAEVDTVGHVKAICRRARPAKKRGRGAGFTVSSLV
ncbi:hypothetical protein Agub_g6410 [Astrephomene gubernaculifera]|uniref:PAS domain-containing protein n=1 Tax=Astrephomene gubernaculifera TaxID=47775 RepID=A0AAD3DND8_9CHLO|nr:hypothetical protein Agub_g6410 [Astrephomene gubernaculifera]